ncbi:MAG: hypothetical protein R3E97_23905 [Candidatus Eisenbacteria bacterium]
MVRAAYTGLQDAERALVAARAHRDRQKFKMRGKCASLFEQLIQVGGGNPKSDVYTRYFEDGYGIYGRVTLERQLELAQSVLVRLDSEANERVKNCW